MHIAKCFLFLLFSCLQWHFVYAQNDECRELLLELHLNSMRRSKDQVCYLDYGVKVVEKKSTTSAVENRVKMYSDSLHQHVLMDKVKLYADGEISISVVPDPKIIMINKLDQKAKNDLKKQSPTSIDSVFFASADIITCKSITGNNHYSKEVELKPKKGVTSGFIRIKYFINEDKKEIYQIKMYYPQASPYSYAEYTFYKVDYNYTEKKINAAIYTLFFNSDGSLIPSYKGYKVVDNRKIKNQN